MLCSNIASTLQLRKSDSKE